MVTETLRQYFKRAQSPGDRYLVAGSTPAELRLLSLGTLDLPSGRLSCVDPFVPYNEDVDSSEVVCTLPPGQYPVSLSVLAVEAMPHHGVPARELGCAAFLRVGPGDAVTWTPAGTEPFQTSAMGVDSGRGCILDADNLTYLGELASHELGASLVTDEAYQVLRAMTQSDAATAITFDCGVGDGGYPVHLGLNKNQGLCQVAVDLELLRSFPPKH